MSASPTAGELHCRGKPDDGASVPLSPSSIRSSVRARAALELEPADEPGERLEPGGPGAAEEVPSALTLVKRLRFLLCLMVLAVLQVGSILPSLQYIRLTFFAQAHGGGDCEAEPTSIPCRQAAADAAVYMGFGKGISSSVAWISAITLGSYSDSVGRRPLLRIASVISLLPMVALGFHLFVDVTLWVYLVLGPLNEAFDINGVMLAFVTDVVVEPKARSTAFAILCVALLVAFCGVLAFAGRITAEIAIVITLSAAVAKIIFVFVFMPETAPMMATERRPPGLLSTATAAWSLMQRNSFILRMVMVLLASGFGAAGLGALMMPYLTAYLGMNKLDSTKVIFCAGFSFLVAMVGLMRPLVKCFGEVFALRVALAALAAFPLLVMSCTEMWHFLVLCALMIGPVAMLFPVTAAIKANLVSSEEQGMLQGVLAAVRVIAVAIGNLFFSWLFLFCTKKGTAPERLAALPPFILSSCLSAIALLIAFTLPLRPPPPSGLQQKELTDQPTLSSESWEEDLDLGMEEESQAAGGLCGCAHDQEEGSEGAA